MQGVILKLAGLLLTVGMPLLAQAEIYVCKDASGRTLTSDRPIMECQDRKVRVLGKNGMTQREIAPPLTEQQKREKAEAEEKQRLEHAAAEEQRRQDRALLARYSKEEDLEMARKRSLLQASENVRREEAVQADTEKSWRLARAEAAKAKGKVPANLQSRINSLEHEVAEGKLRIEASKAEAAKINQKYDQQLVRFRELNAPKSATQSAAR